MRQAALLAQSPNLTLDIRDTGGDPVQAAKVASDAVAQGATALLGPLSAGETIAVLDTVSPTIPVITLSNNRDLAGGGAFVFGITPEQSAEAVFTDALARGLSRIAVVVAPGQYGVAAIEAAAVVADRTGIDLGPIITHDPTRTGLSGRLFARGDSVDAIFLPGGGNGLQAFATQIRKTSDVPFLGSIQWSGDTLNNAPALQGARYAAPNPDTFAQFAASYLSENEDEPGILAALTYDAVQMAGNDGASAAGLLRSSGFDGVIGNTRFRPNRTCARDLTVLTVDNGTA